MATGPRNFPRFLPTLTEVVEPSGHIRAAIAATPDLEDTVWFVMQRVDLVLERRISEEADAMLRRIVAEQMLVMAARLRDELEVTVRQAVSEAFLLRANQHKSK